MSTNTYHNLLVQKKTLSIGPYKISALSTTSFGLDGGAMFGTVPKVLWEKTNPTDDKNRISLDCRCLLLESDESKILIDTGLGGDFVEKYGPSLGPKFAKMYSIPTGDMSGIEKALSEINISTDQITHVILTHLHFDHTGGATKFNGDEIVPTFDNAEYFVQKNNLETALNPNLREKASYYNCNFEPLAKASVLTILEGDQKILPNISFSISNGHTLGQQNVWVDDGVNSLLYCADLIPTATHVRLPWIMGYDINPLLLINEKKKELQKALEKDTLLFFEHDPYCAAATVQESTKGGDFRVKELFNL